MSAGFNTDYKSIIDKAMSQLNALGLDKDGLSAGASTSGSSYVNSVFGLVQDGQNAVDGNDEQKAKAISNIVTGLMDMLTSLGRGEAAKANKETKADSKKVNELENQAQEAFQNTNLNVQELVSQIAQNSESITKALEKIQELGGDDGQIAEAQAQLEEQLKIVEENKNILNDGSATQEQKQAALQAISGAAANINALVETVTGIQEEIQAQNATVEAASNNVAVLTSNAAEAIAKGIEDVQGFVQAGQGLVTKQTTVAAVGAGNEITGKAANQAGQALSKTPMTATQGAKLIMTGVDQSQAGQTRIQASAQNLASLTKSIGEMGSNLSTIAEFTNSVGLVTGGVADLVGQYDAALTPVITATGSWTTVADANANAQLEEAVAAYQETDSTESQENNNKQFDFDVNIFRTAFEEK